MSLIWNNYIIHILDILIISWIFYRIILLIKGTRAVQILLGIVVLAVLTIFVDQVAHLKMLSWLLNRFWILAPIIVAIVFQPELRQMLAQLGGEPLKRIFIKSELKVVKEIIQAIREMSQKKMGALIAIEQEIGLKNYIETGTLIDGAVSSELLMSIFYPKSVLHDGAVIIEHSKLASAGCIFPVSDNPVATKMLGTRHRAALGISEISDAIVIVVSEQTGEIALAAEGKLEQNINPDDLQKKLSNIYRKKLEKTIIPKKENTQNA